MKIDYCNGECLNPPTFHIKYKIKTPPQKKFLATRLINNLVMYYPQLQTNLLILPSFPKIVFKISMKKNPRECDIMLF